MRIGIDLGGTKIEAIALDDNGSTLLRRRVPTPNGDYVGTLNAIADLVLSFRNRTLPKRLVGRRIPRSNLNSDWPTQKLEQHCLERQAVRQ